MISASRFARDLDAGAVEHPCCLRAERAVHERLQVADPNEVVAEAAADPERRELVHLLGGDRLPHAQVQRAFLAEALPDAERAEPAVLVVDRGDAARDRDAHAFAGGLDHLVLGRPHVLVAEVPGALLAQHAGRLAALVADDDTALDLEVAVRVRERGRVQPERVVVAGDQRGRRVAGDAVERLLRRLGRRRPVAGAPARAAEPASRLGCARRLGDTLQRLVERGGVLQPDLPLRERPGREVDVRVGEAGQDAAAAEVDALRARERRLVGADAARDAVARNGQRADEREPGSIVRMTPFSRITRGTLEVTKRET